MEELYEDMKKEWEAEDAARVKIVQVKMREFPISNR